MQYHESGYPKVSSLCHNTVDLLQLISSYWKDSRSSEICSCSCITETGRKEPIQIQKFGFFFLLQFRYAEFPMLALKTADTLCHRLVPSCGPEASQASRSICTPREKTNHKLLALPSLFITVALVRTFFLYLFHLVNFSFRLQRGLRDAAECSNAVWINWRHQCERLHAQCVRAVICD